MKKIKIVFIGLAISLMAILSIKTVLATSGVVLSEGSPCYVDAGFDDDRCAWGLYCKPISPGYWEGTCVIDK